ncbi:MAG: hypothetical protein IT210_20190 [Armatimonadetes bacterium]|nr:hypothetical protein [Armatimonadota bacterium]
MTREEEAERALKRTAITPAISWTLCLGFLLTILATPCAQHMADIAKGMAARRSAVPSLPADSLLPQCYDVFRLLPSMERMGAVHAPQDILRILPSVEEIRDYENTLEERSVVSAWLLPRMQYGLTALLGAGNEQAYCGRDGWLTYRPDVDYLTGPGFLDPSSLRKRAGSGEGGAPIQPDPVKAIVRFHKELSARGIALVVVPVPAKPMIHPEKLSIRYETPQAPLQNPSYQKLLDTLADAGILVYDPSQDIAGEASRTGRAQYLETDTHWTPEAMETAAAGLSRYIRRRGLLPSGSAIAYKRRSAQVDNLGDVAVMLKLPAEQSLYQRQRVEITQVRTPAGASWQPQKDAPILLLGDSFSNIYSLPEMGWGNSGGFAEHISAALERSLDCIVLNAGGSYAARQRLTQELARGEERLAGKRLVIWEFAMRDLLGGDWKLLPFPAHRPS